MMEERTLKVERVPRAQLVLRPLGDRTRLMHLWLNLE
jgi:hypothetical protein